MIRKFNFYNFITLFFILFFAKYYCTAATPRDPHAAFNDKLLLHFANWTTCPDSTKGILQAQKLRFLIAGESLFKGDSHELRVKGLMHLLQTDRVKPYYMNNHDQDTLLHYIVRYGDEQFLKLLKMELWSAGVLYFGHREFNAVNGKEHGITEAFFHGSEHIAITPEKKTIVRKMHHDALRRSSVFGCLCAILYY
jgi:hypothetical protein